MKSVILRKIDEVFDFGGNHVRVGVDKWGNPWFVAKDACDALDIGNISQTLNCLDPDKKGVVSKDTLGGKLYLDTVNEEGLYALVLRSKAPVAMKFLAWVINKVLPAIGKREEQLLPQEIEEVLTDPDTIIQLANTLKEERGKRLEAEKTKAWIGSRREATAMNKASQLSKRVKKLEEFLGEAGDYRIVTAIPWLEEFFGEMDADDYLEVDKELEEISYSRGVPFREVPNAVWGTANAYHKIAIEMYKKSLYREPSCHEGVVEYLFCKGGASDAILRGCFADLDY